MNQKSLLNCRQLAAEIGHGPHYISAMKAAGYAMQYATRDTLENVLAWLEAHPDFRTTEYVERSRTGKGPRPLAGSVTFRPPGITVEAGAQRRAAKRAEFAAAGRSR